MNYIFDSSGYDVEKLIPDVSEALSKRAKLASRRRVPGIWLLNDSPEQETESVRDSRRRKIYRRVVGISMIALGVVMLIVGVTRPDDLLTCIIVGIAGVAVGAHALWNSFRQVENRPANNKPAANYDDIAENYLSNLAKKELTAVWFSEDGMHLGEIAVIGYPEMECFVETPQGYLIVWGKQATFLQKKDLRSGEENEFANFISGKMFRS